MLAGAPVFVDRFSTCGKAAGYKLRLTPSPETGFIYGLQANVLTCKWLGGSPAYNCFKAGGLQFGYDNILLT